MAESSSRLALAVSVSSRLSSSMYRSELSSTNCDQRSLKAQRNTVLAGDRHFGFGIGRRDEPALAKFFSNRTQVIECSEPSSVYAGYWTMPASSQPAFA